ncbi:MAG: autotransporter-associated beta strand repeat-containing protein [Patescibacteria group bacterium]|nr:autotransporter-associated beta strand repeat-containing protein [Patescibacteria group bacterium]
MMPNCDGAVATERRPTRVAPVACTIVLVHVFVGLFAPVIVQAAVTWNGSGDMVWTQPDPTSWSGATYQSGDEVLFSGAGTGTVVINAGGVTPGTVVVSAGGYTLSGGGIGGEASLTKSGTGALILTGDNAYSLATNVSGGTLQVGNGSTTGSLGGGVVALSNTGNIVFRRSDNQVIANTFTWDQASTNGGVLTHSGVGTLTLHGNQDLHQLVVTAGAGALTVSGGTLRLGVANQYTTSISTVAGTTVTVTSALVGLGHQFLYKLGPGTLFLGNAASVGFATGSPVISGGALDIVGSLQETLSARRFVFGGTTANNVLQFNGNLNSLIGSGAGQIGWDQASHDGGFAARGGPAKVNIGGASATLTYRDPGAARFGFIASGRTLVFGSETSDNVVTLVNPLDFAGAAQTVKVIGNSNPNSAAVLAGGLSNGGLTKSGTGTLILTGDNTYSLGTNVIQGTLLVNNATGSGTGSGAVTVSGGATLGGNGRIGGTTTILAGGVLAPGTSVGKLLFEDSLTLAAGAIWSWEFSDNIVDNYDRIVGLELILPDSGAVVLDIHGLADYALKPGDRFTLFDGAVTNFRGDAFQIVDHSGWSDIGENYGWVLSAGSLTLTAVPEPGAWMLLISAMACGLLTRRRKVDIEKT